WWITRRSVTRPMTPSAARTTATRFPQNQPSASHRFHRGRSSEPGGGSGPSRISRADLRISPEGTLERRGAFGPPGSGKEGRDSDTTPRVYRSGAGGATPRGKSALVASAPRAGEPFP